jgi:hypothetical protein
VVSTARLEPDNGLVIDGTEPCKIFDEVLKIELSDSGDLPSLGAATAWYLRKRWFLEDR